MPRLDLELQGLPQGMYAGEVAACTAVLVNRGTLPLRNLQLVLSCPEVGSPWNSPQIKYGPLITFPISLITAVCPILY